VGNHCGKVLNGKAHNDYNKIGIVAKDKQVRDDAQKFFENYFLP